MPHEIKSYTCSGCNEVYFYSDHNIKDAEEEFATNYHENTIDEAVLICSHCYEYYKKYCDTD